jgi:hypothetical protein
MNKNFFMEKKFVWLRIASSGKGSGFGFSSLVSIRGILISDAMLAARQEVKFNEYDEL